MTVIKYEVLLAVTKIGSNGTTGGFVKLTKEDAAEIYIIALNAEI